MASCPHLLSILQATCGSNMNAERLSWKYIFEDAGNLKSSYDGLSKIDEENEGDDKDSEHTTDDDRSEQTETNERLGRLYSYLCATILEETITKMRIMEKCNKNLRVQKVMLDMNLFRGQKYGVEQLANDDDELGRMESIDLHVSKYKIMKLFADRRYITEVIASLFKELTINMCFTGLNKSVRETIHRTNYLVNLKEDENIFKMRAKDLNKQLRQLRNRFKIEIYEKEMMIYTLQIKIKDSRQSAEICDRYVDNWEHSRSEQHNQVLFHAKNKQSEAVEPYKTKYHHEYRAHSELETFLNTVIHETYEKIDEQMDKYEHDMEAMDLKIQIRKHEYLNMFENRIRLEETMIKHEKLIKQWVLYKEECEKNTHVSSEHISLGLYYTSLVAETACTPSTWTKTKTRLRQKR